MRSSALALSFAGVAAVAATLAIKASVTEAALSPDLPAAKAALARHLAGQGFDAWIEDRYGDQDLVRAERGPCRIALRPDQSDEYVASFVLKTPGLDRRGWIDRGRLVSGFPGMASVADNYWRRLTIRLGFAGRERWPVQFADNGRCPLGSIDFGDQLVSLTPRRV